MKTRLSLWGVLPLIVLVALAVMLLLRLENPRMSGSVDSPLVGKSLPDLGVAIKGPAIVNVFASWCAPCRVEHPYLLVAKAKGINIIGIAYKDTDKNIARYLDQLGNPYTDVIDDKDGSLGITLGITGVPESFAVDANGIIRRRLQGPFTSIPDVEGFLK